MSGEGFEHNINLPKEEEACECENEVTDFMNDILLRKIRCSILIFYTYFFDQNIAPHKDAPYDEFYGCFHSTELWYTFNSMRDVDGQRLWTEADHALADQVSGYFANFVKNGDPNGEGLTEWIVGDQENGVPFMWWHDGSSECGIDTEVPGEVALNYEFGVKDMGF